VTRMPGPLRAFLIRRLPMASVLAAVLLDLAPLPFVPADMPLPLFAPAVALFWVLHRPDLFTPLSLVLAGLAFDVLGGLPLGASGLGLLAMAAPLRGRERAVLGQPPLLLWGSLALALALFSGVRWCALIAWTGGLLSPGPALGDYLVTLLVLPAIWRLLVPLLAWTGDGRAAQPA